MLEKYQPQKVLQYFEQICRIPHPSYHCKEISDYLMTFAKEHGLEAYQDEFYNVIIIKEAAAGKEDRKPVMLQGHMDMVAVKDDGITKDMLKEGLTLAVDGDDIYAEGTSLGGDDGIAIAYGLALLDDDTLSLPRIELVVTTEEEVGMEGATGIDLSVCQAECMINLDSEDEGQFVAACAGGVRVHADMMASHKEPMRDEQLLYSIEVSGLTGGHSGTEIIRNSANASKVLGSALHAIRQMGCDFMLENMQGGTKDNAIPVYAEAVIAISGQDEEKLVSCADVLQEKFVKQYADTDPEGCIRFRQVETAGPDASQSVRLFSKERTGQIVDFLCEVPNGVQSMSKDMPGLVQTSLNLGIMKGTADGICFDFSLRSSVSAEKQELRDRVCGIIKKYDGTFETGGDYPAWEYKADSPLREHLVAVYQKQYQEMPEVLSIHAGLECGILAAKKPGLDCVSVGPDILDIHTTREKLRISSVQRVWKFLVEALETL